MVKKDVELTDLPHAAGGIGALWSTAKFVARGSGLVRGGKALLAMNQVGGFDCPGCAWPEPAKRDRFEFCENGAKAIAEEATTARLTPDVFAALSIEELRLLSEHELGQLGRITHPMVLDGSHYRPIAWDAACSLWAEELRAAGPERSVFYTSGRTSNEAAFLLQLVGRMFGTNNFPDCSNMCHESSGVALSQVLGIGKGTVSISDFEHADLIFVVGQNPGTNHPRMLTTLREAAHRGATIVAVNPLREVALTRFAHPQKPLDMVVSSRTALAKHFVQVQIGGDQAFFLGLSKAVLERDGEAARAREDAPTVREPLSAIVDLLFIAEYTDGFGAWRDHVIALPWEMLEAQSGVSQAVMRELAELYIASPATITCWAMGLTQHKHSVATIQEIVNFMLLRGNVGRPGAGLCPVRGHSNVQGDRTMGIYHLPRPAFLDALGKTFGFEPPRAPGVDTIAAIKGMESGALSVFVGMGGNFLSAGPDTDRIAAGLSRCAMTVAIATKLNRTHLYPGSKALLLPCLGRSEVDRAQFVTVEDSMSMVHASQGVLAPVSDALKSEIEILCGLGAALHGPVQPWGDFAASYDLIRDRIAEVVPGFERFNARVREAATFQLPNVARDRTFSSIGGRAKFTVASPPDLTLPPGRLRMMTIRSHDQYNTTIYGLDDRYRGIRGERRVIFMNATDMVDRHLIDGQLVDLVSEWTDRERRAESFVVVSFDIPRGNCATYFPEANPLVPLDSVADRSNTPTSKSVIIRVIPRS